MKMINELPWVVEQAGAWGNLQERCMLRFIVIVLEYLPYEFGEKGSNFCKTDCCSWDGCARVEQDFDYKLKPVNRKDE